jgi:L-fuconolactonase
MPVVDSHCHVSPTWYEPVEVLLFQMDRNRVDNAVLIQMKGQANNEYQTECVRRYPGRFASVVVVDEKREDASRILERLAEQGASGLRLGPTDRSPGSDPLAIWRTAERLGLAVSCGGRASDFAAPEFTALVQALPGLTIVIEHLGNLNHPTNANDEQLRARVFGLSRFPNVYMKIHGLGEFCERAMPVTEPFPFRQPIPTLLEQAYQAFGPRRLMWGSDYPPVSGREGYRNALHLTMEQFAGKSTADRDEIFGGTALRVFPIRH